LPPCLRSQEIQKVSFLGEGLMRFYTLTKKKGEDAVLSEGIRYSKPESDFDYPFVEALGVKIPVDLSRKAPMYSGLVLHGGLFFVQKSLDDPHQFVFVNLEVYDDFELLENSSKRALSAKPPVLIVSLTAEKKSKVSVVLIRAEGYEDDFDSDSAGEIYESSGLGLICFGCSEKIYFAEGDEDVTLSISIDVKGVASVEKVED